ncbi:phage tail tape measure protein [Cellulosimicrobium sp. NPDC057862]|uniref:phage tail tape measure protein n=1 Tax=Actinomycetes TaxID=1760 RepID=UPI003672A59E
MSTNPRDVNVNVSMNPKTYVDGADKVSLATKRMLREQEAADRKFRALATAQGSAQREDEARQQALADAVAKAEREKQDAYDATGKVLLAGSAAIVTGLGFAAKAASDWESAWAGVVKTTDATEEQLPALEQGLRDLTKVLPASHAEIAAVAEAAGQLGVKSADVVGFTKVMIDLGEATNLTSDEAATALAQLMNIMQTAPADVSRLGATLVALGNNGASTERDIMNLGLRLAGASRVARISEADMLAIANAMSSVGIEAEAGGTAMSMVITKLANTVRAGGRDLEAFASVSGMTAEQFAAAWRERPAVALDAFTTGLGRMNDSGGDVFGTLTDLGFTGERIRDTLLRLAGSGDLLTESLDIANTAWEENNALVEEAGKRYATTQSRVSIAKNQLSEVGIELGEVLLPALANTADAVADLLGWFAALPQPVKDSVTILGGVAAAAGVAGAAFLMLPPRIAAARASLAVLNRELPRTTTTLGRVSKAAGIAGAALAALAIVSAATTKDVSLGAAEMEERVRGLASSKDVVGDLFGDLVPKDSDLQRGKDFAAFLHDMAEPGAWKSLGASISDAGVTVTRFFGDDTAKWGELKTRLDEVGDSIASLATSGDLTTAQKSFKALADEAGGTEEATSDLLKTMPAYRDALIAQASAAKLSMDETTLLKLATGDLVLTQQEVEAAVAAADEQMATHAATLGMTKEAYEELLKAVQAQRDAWSEAAAGFVDINGTYTSMLEDRKAADEEAARKTAEARGEEGDAWKNYVTDVKVNLDEYLAELQRQAEAQAAWKSNMLSLVGQVSDGTLDYLARLGPEGAPLVQALVDGSVEQLQEFDRLGTLAMADAHTNWVLEAEKARPLLERVMADHGEAAAESLKAALAAGETTVADAAARLGYALEENVPGEYDITVALDGSDAAAQLQTLLAEIDSSDGMVTIYADDQESMRTLDDVTAQINEADGTVTIFGNDGKAITTLKDYKSTVDASSGTVVIRGNDASGRATTVTLTNWVDGQGAAIDVGADTSSARSTVTAFVQEFNGRRIPIYFDAKQGTQINQVGYNSMAQANGGVVDYFANGSENHVAQIAPAGSWRVWGEPETGGEAYIPLSPFKRTRSEEIFAEVANRFGYDIAKRNQNPSAPAAQYAASPAQWAPPPQAAVAVTATAQFTDAQVAVLAAAFARGAGAMIGANGAAQDRAAEYTGEW